MSKEIPLNDPDLKDVDSPRNSGRERFEFELLETEVSLRKLLRREASQRYAIRWLAVAAGVSVIIGMAVFLCCIVSNVMWGSFVFTNSAFSVTVVAAPVLSITTITVAFFVGAFRKFEDKDIETMGNGVSGLANIVRGEG